MKTLDRKATERTTTERPLETSKVSGSPSSRSTLVLAIVAVVALLLGALGGWAIRGSDGDSAAETYVAGGGELTDRQEEMLDLLDDYEAAWRSADGDAAAAFFTSGGRFAALGKTYRVSDGGIADFVDGGSWAALDIFEPFIVHENIVVSTHNFERARGNVYVFTMSGDPLIVSHTIVP